MKWESDEIPIQMPNNVLTLKWLPQNDILAHPSIRLFISHCGLGGVAEARFYGVPILGIPLFGDQPENLRTIVKEGWAVALEFNDITDESLSQALNEILLNKAYRDVVRRSSVLYRDRPQSALDTAVFWIEYVLRHNGANHLQNEAVHLNFFQNNSLDVFGFFFVVAVIAWKVIEFSIIKVFRIVQNSKVFGNKIKVN